MIRAGAGVVVHNRVNAAKKSQERQTRAKTGHCDCKEAGLHLPVDPSQAQIAVQDNVDAPAIEGMLKKRAATLFGFGAAVWHQRYVLLDPHEGILSYWEPGDLKEWANNHLAMPGVRGWEPGIIKASAKPRRPTQAPKQTFMLRDIIQVESNHRHGIFQIVFCKAGKQRDVGKVLQLQAESELQFNQWVEAFRPYGMRKGPTTPSAKGNNTAH